MYDFLRDIRFLGANNSWSCCPASTSPNTAAGIYINTIYQEPTGGTEHDVGCTGNLALDSFHFTQALSSASPGDIIKLTAGCYYQGTFILPAKSNPDHKWIYIISSELSSLPEGVRVSPSQTQYMPKITTPSAPLKYGPAIQLSGGTSYGSNFYRLVGLELYSVSTTPVSDCIYCNPFSYNLIGWDTLATAFPNHIFVDRSYVHGDTSQSGEP